MKRKLGNLLIIFVLLAAILTASACSFVNNDEASGGQEEQQSQTYSSSHLVKDTTVSLKDSIGISATGASFNSSTAADDYNDLEELFESTNVKRSVVTIYCVYGSTASIGSGVIVDVDDGVDFGSNEGKIFYIITCHHVIDSLPNYNHSVTVYVPDEEGDNYDDEEYNDNYAFTGVIGGDISSARLKAVSLVGGDKYSDIAVLRLYVSDTAVADTIIKAKVIGADETLKEGKKVFAAGNPQGLHAGWDSGVGSIADVRCSTLVENIGRMNLIGINVNTYPGSSGGGLFNMKGELIGITNSGDAVEVKDVNGTSQVISQGLNYAIPHKNSDDARKDKGFINVAEQLIDTYLAADGNYGYVYGRRVQFGFISQNSSSGVVVASVSSDSMAYSAGLRTGDIITKVQLNGGEERTVSANADLDEVLSTVSAGDVVRLSVTRSNGGYRKTTSNVQITLNVYQYYFCNTQNYQGISQ